MDYPAYLQTAYWTGVKRRLNARYPGCFVCMKKGSGEGHHVRYDRLGKERIGVDVFKLCDACHSNQHYLLNRFRLPLSGLPGRLKRSRFWWSVIHGHPVRAALTLIVPLRWLS